MYLLAIDTATNSGGAALARNAEVVGMVMLKTPLEYSEKLIYCVEFLLHQFKLKIKDVDCIGVTTGPGSFTGVRIGLATVKGFCQGLTKPAVGISTLEALAYRFRWVHSRIAPMIDARRQQVYGGVYGVEEEEIQVEQKAWVGPPAEWLKGLPKDDYLFVGDGAQLYRNAVSTLKPRSRLLETDNRLLEALCALAYQRFRAGKTLAAEELQAHYVRPSDAEKSRDGQ